MLEAERVQAEILRVIGDDPTISDARRVVVTVEKKGFLKGRGEKVVLRGTVHSDLDRAKIEKVAALHAGGREVVDEITVVH